MALNLPVFYQRTASAIVFAAIMLTGLLWNQWSFIALMYVINTLCLREYFRLMKRLSPEVHWPAWLTAFFHILSCICLLPAVLTGSYGTTIYDILFPVSDILPLFLILLPALLMFTTLLAKRTAWLASLQSLGGLAYITLPMFLLIMTRINCGITIPAALIFMIWSNDTLAYLVGSFIGKTPFSPISPKKTWEGTGGGAILTVIAAVLYGYFSHQYQLIDWIVIALCATVAGTLGDLVESKLKRMADVKDSGAMMPGHGGALDRFDSLLLAAPFAAVYCLYFMHR